MSKLDLSEFKALSHAKRDCPVNVADLEPPDRELLEAALAENPRMITNKAISAWLERRQVTIAPPTIAYHRNGKCACHV